MREHQNFQRTPVLQDQAQVLTQADEDNRVRKYLVYAIAISFVALCARYVRQKLRKVKDPEEVAGGGCPPESLAAHREPEIPDVGLSIHKIYASTRLLCCLSLFLLSTLEFHDDSDYFGIINLTWTPQNSEMACYVSLPFYTSQKLRPRH